MAHVVRPERPKQNGHAHDGAEEVSIDLRHGDLSDDEVVELLLRLARERASAEDEANRSRRTEALAGPARTRHRVVPTLTTLATVGAVAVVLVGVLIVLAVRASERVTTEPGLAAAAAAPGPSTLPVPSTTVRTPLTSSRPAATTPPSIVPTSIVPTSVTDAASTAGAAGEPTSSFCRAVSIYTLDNLIILAENGVRDPRGTIAAYGTMVANAPPEIADDVTALGPITGKVQIEIEQGRITTPEQMQQFLAGGAPTDEVARWIAAQQAIVAQLPVLCPGRPTP